MVMVWKHNNISKYQQLTSSVLSIASRMLPIAVLDPTPTTTALALPATTTVPWKGNLEP